MEGLEPYLRRLIEAHRPVWEDDPFGFSGLQKLVHCKACDGNEWHIWQKGDEPYACDIWKENEERLGDATSDEP